MQWIGHKGLVFKEFAENEQPLLEAVLMNPKVMRYTFDDCYDIEKIVAYHKTILKNNQTTENRPSYEYAVFDRENYIGLADIIVTCKKPLSGIADIGYFLLPDYWGKGYATRIVGALIQTCFKQLGFHKVTASCNAENIGSYRAMEKNNMVREGVMKQQRYKNQAWVDEYHYAILRDASAPSAK